MWKRTVSRKSLDGKNHFENCCDLYNSWFPQALYFCPFKSFHILKLPGALGLFAWEWTNKPLLLLKKKKKKKTFPSAYRNDIFVQSWIKYFEKLCRNISHYLSSKLFLLRRDIGPLEKKDTSANRDWSPVNDLMIVLGFLSQWYSLVILCWPDP